MGLGISSWTKQTEEVLGTDYVAGTDRSDTTQSPEGTTKAVMWNQAPVSAAQQAAIDATEDLIRETISTAVYEVENIAELKALTSFVNYVIVRGRINAGDGGGGLFIFSSADLSAGVTADTTNAVYVPPNSGTSGTGGAWIRQFSGPLYSAWFGALPGTTNNYAALQAAFVLINYFGGGELKLSGTADTFNISLSARLYLYSNTTFDLSGNTIHRQDVGSFATLANIGYGVTPDSNITIKNGTITGSGANSTVTDQGSAITLYGIDGFLIEGIKTDNTSGDGIAFREADNGTLRDIIIGDFGRNGISPTSGCRIGRNSPGNQYAGSGGKFGVVDRYTVLQQYLPYGQRRAKGHTLSRYCRCKFCINERAVVKKHHSLNIGSIRPVNMSAVDMTGGFPEQTRLEKNIPSHFPRTGNTGCHQHARPDLITRLRIGKTANSASDDLRRIAIHDKFRGKILVKIGFFVNLAVDHREIFTAVQKRVKTFCLGVGRGELDILETVTYTGIEHCAKVCCCRSNPHSYLGILAIHSGRTVHTDKVYSVL